MYVTWLDTYATGVDSIDNQHRHLFKMINELYEFVCAHQNNSQGQLSVLLERFSLYADEHFTNEEWLMKEFGLSAEATAEHRQEHFGYCQRVNRFRKAIQAGDQHAATQLMSWLGGWWLGHVTGRDQELGRQIRQILDETPSG